MKLDQQEREAVLRALSVLPHDHPARIAFDQGADPVALMHLLEGDETVENLKEIWLAAYETGRYDREGTRDPDGWRNLERQADRDTVHKAVANQGESRQDAHPGVAMRRVIAFVPVMDQHEFFQPVK